MLRQLFLSIAVFTAIVTPLTAQLTLTQVSSGQFNSPLALVGAPNDPNTNQAFVLQRAA